MICWSRATVALPAILLTLARPCVGQTWQVDVNGTAAQYDTGARAASAAVAPQIEWSAARSLAVLGATVAAMEGSQWSAQARGEGWLFLLPEPQSRFGASLSAGGIGTLHSSGYRTAATSAEARVLFVGKAGGAWVGASGATGWTSSAAYPFVSSWGPTAGFWGRVAAWSGSLAVRPFRFQQSWFPEVSGSMALTRGRANLTAFAGWRGAPAGSGVSSLGWGGAAVAVHLAGRLAVTLGAGTYPADFLQAFPRGRYASFGIRIAHRFPAILREAAALYLPSNRTPAGQELRFAVAGATSVAVAGDWTGWAPVELRPGPNGSWTLRVTLPSGVYRFNLVVDGQRWIVPSEVQGVDDGMGGKTGLLVIPE